MWGLSLFPNSGTALCCIIKRTSPTDTIQGRGLVGSQSVAWRRRFVQSLPSLCLPRPPAVPRGQIVLLLSPCLSQKREMLNSYKPINPASCCLQHAWRAHPSLFLLRLDLGCFMKNNFIWSAKRWMSRRRELKRNYLKKKKSSLGYWSKKGALCQADVKPLLTYSGTAETRRVVSPRGPAWEPGVCWIVWLWNLARGKILRPGNF